MVLEGFPLLGFSGILPEGLSGPAPTGGLLSCAGISPSLPPPLGEGREGAGGGGGEGAARGPLPAPWTPGAVVPDLRPLLAFNLEPSSGLSAAWVDTRRPPPLGSAWRRGRGLGAVSPTEGGIWRVAPLRRCGPPPLSKGGLRGVGGWRRPAVAAFWLLELGGDGVWGHFFYGGWQRADRTSPALRATSPFQGEAERGGRLAASGCWNWKGMGFEGLGVLRRATVPLSKGSLGGVGGGCKTAARSGGNGRLFCRETS